MDVITCQVWRAVRYAPAAHPFYRLAGTRAPAVLPRVSGLAVGTVLLLFVMVMALSPDLSAWILNWALLLIPAVAAKDLFTGSWYGALWAVRIVHALAAVRRAGIYDLLCLTPAGPLSVHGLIGIRTLQQTGALDALRAPTLWSTRIILITPAVIILSVQTDLLNDPGWFGLALAYHLGVLVGWLQLEDRQAVALGGLLGMLIPAYSRESVEGRTLVTVSFVGVQLMIYAGVLLLVHALYVGFWPENRLLQLAQPAVALALLGFVRESVLKAFWWHLKKQLQLGSDTLFELVRKRGAA